MTLSAVPPELIGILDSSTVSDEDKAMINSFFASLDPAKRPDVMKEVRSRPVWRDKLNYVLSLVNQ